MAKKKISKEDKGNINSGLAQINQALRDAEFKGLHSAGKVTVRYGANPDNPKEGKCFMASFQPKEGGLGIPFQAAGPEPKCVICNLKEFMQQMGMRAAS